MCDYERFSFLLHPEADGTITKPHEFVAMRLRIAEQAAQAKLFAVPSDG